MIVPKNKYHQQALLHFGPLSKIGQDFIAVKEAYHGQKFNLINLQDVQNGVDHAQLNASLTTRIYVHAHGSSEYNKKIKSDEGDALTVTELANLLAPLLAKFTKENYFNSYPRPLISLLVCFAGANAPDRLQTFAGKLQRRLAKQGIYFDFHARIASVSATGNMYTGKKKFILLPEDEKQFNELTQLSNQAHNARNVKAYLYYQEQARNLLRHKQPGSKYTFIWEQDAANNLQQTVYESYTYVAYRLKRNELHKNIDHLKKCIDDLPNQVDVSDTGADQKDKIFTTLYMLYIKLTDLIRDHDRGIHSKHELNNLQKNIMSCLEIAENALHGIRISPFNRLSFTIRKNMSQTQSVATNSASFFVLTTLGELREIKNKVLQLTPLNQKP